MPHVVVLQLDEVTKATLSGWLQDAAKSIASGIGLSSLDGCALLTGNLPNKVQCFLNLLKGELVKICLSHPRSSHHNKTGLGGVD